MGWLSDIPGAMWTVIGFLIGSGIVATTGMFDRRARRLDLEADRSWRQLSELTTRNFEHLKGFTQRVRDAQVKLLSEEMGFFQKMVDVIQNAPPVKNLTSHCLDALYEPQKAVGTASQSLVSLIGESSDDALTTLINDVAGHSRDLGLQFALSIYNIDKAGLTGSDAALEAGKSYQKRRTALLDAISKVNQRLDVMLLGTSDG